jgi:hypothetical protein
MGTRAPREVPTGLTGTQEVTKENAERKDPLRGARAGIGNGVLKEVFPHKVLLPATNGWSVTSCLNQRRTDPMDHDHDQGTPLTSLMNWDRNGELRSEDLERLLERLQAIEVSSLPIVKI